jgi:hypothetical protein
MVKVYANLIYEGVLTIEDVPTKLRLAVETRLEELYRAVSNT